MGVKNDLSGQKFGRLTVIKLDEEKNAKNKQKGTYKTYYICKCECGNVKSIVSTSLKNGQSKSCGCLSREKVRERSFKDLTGKTFGRLTVLGLDKEANKINKIKKNYKTRYICKCECGTIKSIEGSNLKSGDVRSCGCLNREKASERAFRDLTGRTFGRLRVLELDKIKNEECAKKGSYSKYYICQCECGTVKSIEGGNLRSGHTISCGCYHKEVLENSYEDLSGKKSNMLTAIRRVYIDSKNEYYWECRCDCGKLTYLEAGNFKSGNTKSCGCIMSDHERNVKNNLIGEKFGKLNVLALDVLRHYRDKEEKGIDRTYWLCQCECGNITSVSSSALISGGTKSCGCYAKEVLSGENNHNWKGGVSELDNYLRGVLKEWKMDSLASANYRCIISADTKDLVIHHIYPFSKIVSETLLELNMATYKTIGEYSKDELQKIKELLIKKHYEYGYGAVISKDIHDEFHNIYGKGANKTEPPSIKEWNEFVENKLKEVC